MKKWLFVGIMFLASFSFADDEEIPPFEVKDPAATENFRQVYYNSNKNKKDIDDLIDNIYLNVKSYGAKGDGATNDRDAIQSTINTVVDKTLSGTVLIPKGTYKINSTLNVDVSRVSILCDAAILDFSGMALSTEALHFIGGSNVYSGGTPYYNGTHFIQGCDIRGPDAYGAAGDSKGLSFWTVNEPGPSHYKVRDNIISAFNTAVFISTNAYIIKMEGNDIFVSSVCVLVDYAANSGEGISVVNTSMFNSIIGMKLINPSATTNVFGGSIDGMNSMYIYQTAGYASFKNMHFEGNFAPDYTGARVYWAPPTTLTTTNINFDRNYFVIKSTRDYPVVEINAAITGTFTDNWFNTTVDISSSIISSTVANSIITHGNKFSTNDTHITEVGGYWHNDFGTISTDQQIYYKGTTTGDEQSAGNVGETTSSETVCSTPRKLTNGEYVDIATVTLTAGDWIVEPSLNMISYSAVTGTQFLGGIGTAAGNDGTGLIAGKSSNSTPTAPTGSSDSSIPVPPGQRRNIIATTVYYLKAYAGFSGGDVRACGGLFARRWR